MSNIVQFPIGETQQKAQRQQSEKFAAGLCGNFPTAKILPFALVTGESAIVPDIAQA